MIADATPQGDETATSLVPVDEDTWHHISDRCSNLCYHAAKFHLERQRFIDREGGLWLLADSDAEVQAADAFYRMELHLPLGETDMSALAVLLADTPHEELDPFEERLVTTDAWPILRDLWIEWASEAVETGELPKEGQVEGYLVRTSAQDCEEYTTGDPSALRRASGPVSATECGRWLRAGEDFIALIDADWWRVADWYRARRG